MHDTPKETRKKSNGSKNVLNARTHSYSVIAVPSPDGEWGVLRSGANGGANGSANSTWTGLVGQLERGEADLCFSGLVATSARADFIDFSVPYLVRQNYKKKSYRKKLKDRLECRGCDSPKK